MVYILYQSKSKAINAQTRDTIPLKINIWPNWGIVYVCSCWEKWCTHKISQFCQTLNFQGKVSIIKDIVREILRSNFCPILYECTINFDC
jgi:hypothetical protein